MVYSMYNKGFVYCSRCGKWIKKEDVKNNGKGKPRCPECNFQVRIKPRKRKRRVVFACS